MDILFIHPHFPGQFLRIAQELAKNIEYSIYGLGDEKLYTDKIDGVELFLYESPPDADQNVHRYNRPMEKAVRRAQIVSKRLMKEKAQGFDPDIIFVHPGWGDAFFLKEIFPMTPIIGFFEYFYHSRGADVGFDPEFPMVMDDIFRLKTLNALQLLAMESCDIGITPTKWQKKSYAWSI